MYASVRDNNFVVIHKEVLEYISLITNTAESTREFHSMIYSAAEQLTLVQVYLKICLGIIRKKQNDCDKPHKVYKLHSKHLLLDNFLPKSCYFHKCSKSKQMKLQTQTR